MYAFSSINQALIGMSRELLSSSIKRETRGFTCYELPHPVTIAITNPGDRYITIQERKWNKLLPWLESLWMGLGLNDLSALPGRYVKSLYNYSDDGHTWRGGYGPRLRAYTGNPYDYYISRSIDKQVYNAGTITVDQIKYVVDKLRQSNSSRQAIIQIGDPAKDNYKINGDLVETKDYPCTRTIQFMIVNGRLNCTVYMRSNDLYFGFSAVNVFNFTLMQEYIARIIGVPVGIYYHIANNLHFYDRHLSQIRNISNLNADLYRSEHPKFYYDGELTWEQFNLDMELLKDYADELYNGSKSKIKYLHSDYQLFQDWANVLFKHHNPGAKVDFINPNFKNIY